MQARSSSRGARPVPAGVLLAAFVACTDASTATGGANAIGEVAAEDEAESITVSGTPGAMAPAFTLAGPDGASVRLEELRGDVVYVDFWASWCAPCLQSFPWMNGVAERFRADGLRVVAINLDEDREAAERFLADVRADFDIAFDPDGGSAEAYGLLGMPSSYVIGRDGRVAHAHVGFRRKDAPALEAAIAEALEAPPVTSVLVVDVNEAVGGGEPDGSDEAVEE